MHPESSESTWIYEALAWIELNRKWLIGGGVVVLAIIVGGYIYDWHAKHVELEANKALFALESRAGGQDQPSPLSATDLLAIVSEHAGTSAAQRALLLAAGDMYAQGKYAESHAQFEKFVAQHSSSPLAPTAALGIASCLDAQDKLDQAIVAYQRLITRHPAEPAAARARLNLALIHETRNQPDQALRLYDELNKPNTYGAVATEASRRRERLLLKNPQLAPTNATATTTVVKPPARQSQSPTNAATGAATLTTNVVVPSK